MKRVYAPLERAMAGAVALAAFAVAGLPASAQETSPSASTATSATKKVPRTTATPEMIADAIERSKSRTERFKATGVPEQFGSEDPAKFPTKK